MCDELMNTREDCISDRSLTTSARRSGIVAGAFLGLLPVAAIFHSVATADIGSPAAQTATITAPQNLHPVPTRNLSGDGIFIGVLLVIAAVIMRGRKETGDVGSVIYRKSPERSNA
jgi:hypothetical protein